VAAQAAQDRRAERRFAGGVVVTVDALIRLAGTRVA
jgi:hypothetical protein